MNNKSDLGPACSYVYDLAERILSNGGLFALFQRFGGLNGLINYSGGLYNLAAAAEIGGFSHLLNHLILTDRLNTEYYYTNSNYAYYQSDTGASDSDIPYFYGYGSDSYSSSDSDNIYSPFSV